MLGIVHGCYGGISGHVAAGGSELGAAARDSFATPPPNVCSQQPTIITMSQGFEMTNHKRVASEVATQCEREHAKPSLVYDACGRGDALEAQQAHVFIGVLLAPGGCGDGVGAAGNGVAPTATFLCAFVLALVELGDLKFSITRSLAQPRDVVARSLAFAHYSRCLIVNLSQGWHVLVLLCWSWSIGDIIISRSLARHVHFSLSL